MVLRLPGFVVGWNLRCRSRRLCCPSAPKASAANCLRGAPRPRPRLRSRSRPRSRPHRPGHHRNLSTRNLVLMIAFFVIVITTCARKKLCVSTSIFTS
ncbi:Protein of unknown function, partial [Gryllus bimaculatus]